MTPTTERQRNAARNQYLREWDALEQQRHYFMTVRERYRIDRAQESLTRTFHRDYPRSTR